MAHIEVWKLCSGYNIAQIKTNNTVVFMVTLWAFPSLT